MQTAIAAKWRVTNILNERHCLLTESHIGWHGVNQWSVTLLDIFTHHAGRHVGSVYSGVYVFVCLFVCLFVFPHDVSKTDAAGITKPKTEMFYHESWKPIYFRVKRSRSRDTKNIAGMGQGALVSAVFLYILICFVFNLCRRRTWCVTVRSDQS